MGFLGLAVATVAFAAPQPEWVPQDDGCVVALPVLVLTVPVQALACVGFLAVIPLAAPWRATGMGALAGTWAPRTLCDRPGSR